MVRSGSIQGFFGRSLAVGCALTGLVAGTAWASGQEVSQSRAAVEAVAAKAVAARPSNSDLYVVRIDPDPAPPGGETVLHAFVGNLGPDRTASPFTIVVTLPEGVTSEEPYFPEDCYPFQNGHKVRCTFPAGLGQFRSATAQIPLRLGPGVPLGTLTGGYVKVRSDDDRNEANNRQPFEIQVVETTEG